MAEVDGLPLPVPFECAEAHDPLLRGLVLYLEDLTDFMFIIAKGRKGSVAILTIIFLGPVPWISYAMSKGPPRPFATEHLPFLIGLRSQITLWKAGCARISSARRGIFAFVLENVGMAKSVTGLLCLGFPVHAPAYTISQCVYIYIYISHSTLGADEHEKNPSQQDA